MKKIFQTPNKPNGNKSQRYPYNSYDSIRIMEVLTRLLVFMFFIAIVTKLVFLLLRRKDKPSKAIETEPPTQQVAGNSSIKEKIEQTESHTKTKDLYNKQIELKEFNRDVEYKLSFGKWISQRDMEELIQRFNKLKSYEIDPDEFTETAVIFGRLKKYNKKFTEKLNELNKEMESRMSCDKWIEKNTIKQLIEQYIKVKEEFEIEPSKLRKTDGLVKKLNKYNEYLLERLYRKHSKYFKKHGLSRTQSEAVLKDDKYSLVVAGPGSGKTKTIVEKSAYLVEKCNVKPSKILILSFNKKVAEEVQKKLEKRKIKDVEIRTFHALGYKILKELSGKVPNLISNENSEKQELYSNLLQETTKDNSKFDDLIKIIDNLDIEKSEVDFETREEYYNYMKGKKFYALDGTKLKSKAEKIIANFLICHGIRFEYETIAEWADDDKQHKKFRPDFYLPECDLHIEHSALDDAGNPPPWDDNKRKWYVFKHTWVTNQYKKHGKKYLITNSTDQINGMIESKIISSFQEHNIPLRNVPYEELVNSVFETKKRCSIVVKLIASFINIAKSNMLTTEEISNRIKQCSGIKLTFAKLALEMYERYQEYLKQKSLYDFQDLINEAIRTSKEAGCPYRNQYEYILVDEFQDISHQRAELIKTIMNNENKTKLFCVGDDWQSIYGFAGAEVDIFINFESHFGNYEKTILDTNYRCSNSHIFDAANRLMANNEFKLDREMNIQNKDKKEKITVLGICASGNAKYNRIANALLRKFRLTTNNTLVLGRYKFNDTALDRLKNLIHGKNKPTFMTVHAAKGQEADKVVVVDLFDGEYGFPTRIEDSSLLDVVKIKKSNLIEEERRLFFVAMTRAKKKLYLLTKNGQESRFIEEIEPFIERLSINENEEGKIIVQKYENTKREACLGARLHNNKNNPPEGWYL